MLRIIGALCVLCSVSANPYSDLLLPHSELLDLNISEIIEGIHFNLTELCENLPTMNLTSICASQMEIVCDNATLQFTLYDASSKFPYPGLIYATKRDFGNFDQCLSINHWENDIRVLGKFCASSLLIPSTLNGTIEEIAQNAYQLSLCIPDQCAAADVLIFFGIPSSLPIVNDLACSTIETDTEITGGDIAVLAVFVLIICLMVLSTIYDFYLQQNARKPRNIIFVSFSVLSNGRKLLQTSEGSKEQIMVFHGIKFISMMWILAGHGFAVLSVAPFSNDADAQSFQSKRYSQYITTAYIAVDTFFFISGFLLAYQYFKTKPKPLMIQIFKVPNMYLHRYLRLTPALLMVFVFHLTLNKHIGQGPISHFSHERLQKTCTDNWWAFFLYIQNYHNPGGLCLTHTWYLSADMQMFILAPLVLIPVSLHIKRRFRLALLELLLLNIFLTILPIVLKLCIRSYDNEYDTHSRLINFFVGVMFAIYLRESKEKPFAFNQKMNSIIWIVIISGMITIFLCYQEVEINHGFESNAIFAGLYRPAWCICLCWIVYSCYHGQGGIVSWILSAPVFQIGSKLTYCMYLVHGHVIIIHFLYLRNRIHFSDYEMFYIFCGHLMFTCLVAVFWTLAFESPLITIEKMIFGNPNTRNPQRPVEKKSSVPRDDKTPYLNGNGIYKVKVET